MELANRMEHEADFAKQLSRLSSKHRRELIELMGSPPDPAKVPAEFWAKVEKEHNQTVTAILYILFISAGEQHAEALLPSDLRAVATDSLQDRAASWSSQRAAVLSNKYATRSREMAGRLGTRWYGPDFVVNRLFGEMKPPGSEAVQSGAIEIFGPNRDADIAATETTKAATAGTHGARGAAENLGVNVKVTWHCEDDGRECPYCGALHLQDMENWEAVLIAANAPPRVIDEVRENGGPTAHPVCRCWLEVKREPLSESWDASKHPRDSKGRFSDTATGKPIEFIPHPYAESTETTVMVDADKLDQAWQSDQTGYIPAGGGGNEIAGRREQFVAFMQGGKPIQASRIYVKKTGQVVFSDGRHRFSVLRDIGAKRVAVTLAKSEKALARKFLGVTE